MTPSQTSEKHHVFLRKTKSVQLLGARYVHPGLLSKHRHMQVLEQKVMQQKLGQWPPRLYGGSPAGWQRKPRRRWWGEGKLVI